MAEYSLSIRTVRALAFLAPLLLIAGCVESEKLATVQASRIVGTWSDSSDGQISLFKNRTFEARGINIRSFIYAACPTGDSTGTWGFFVDEGKPGGLVFASKEALSGDTLSISFDDIPEDSCAIRLNVIKDGEMLCASDDPDFTCELETRFSRQ